VAIMPITPSSARSLAQPLIPTTADPHHLGSPAQGWFAVDLLATFPVDYIVRAVEGTWVCSLRGDCLWAATASGGAGVSAIRILRVLRVFR
jgi:hypothetical protein